MRKHDWADELARQIARDFNVPVNLENHIKLDLVAARLRVVRQEGVGDGIKETGKAVDGVFAAAKQKEGQHGNE